MSKYGIFSFDVFPLTVVKQAKALYRIMKHTLTFFIFSEDWKIIQDKAPKLAVKVREFYGIDRTCDKRLKIDYCRFFWLPYAFQPHLRRKFFHLIHSFHCMACECYRLGDFSSYLVFDGFMSRLIMRLL